MRFVNIESEASYENFVEMLNDNERTNRNVAFEPGMGRPYMHITEKHTKIKIKCELMERNSRDNGFLEGTYFKGKITSTDTGTKIKGVIVTAPVFHMIMLVLLVSFIIACFVSGGFSVMPIILVIFDVFMFFTEFKKQGIIYRYILRASRRASDPKYKR